MKAKELVAEFYQSDALRDCDVMKRFLHDNIELHWHSSKGFLKMDKEDLIVLAGEMKRSYTSSRVEFTHLLEDNNSVTARYTYYVTPIESNEEEVVLAEFITIWEVKDGKLFRGYQMSQLS